MAARVVCCCGTGQFGHGSWRTLLAMRQPLALHTDQVTHTQHMQHGEGTTPCKVLRLLRLAACRVLHAWVEEGQLGMRGNCRQGLVCGLCGTDKGGQAPVPALWQHHQGRHGGCGGGGVVGEHCAGCSDCLRRALLGSGLEDEGLLQDRGGVRTQSEPYDVIRQPPSDCLLHSLGCGGCHVKQLPQGEGGGSLRRLAVGDAGVEQRGIRAWSEWLDELLSIALEAGHALSRCVCGGVCAAVRVFCGRTSAFQLPWKKWYPKSFDSAAHHYLRLEPRGS